MSLFNELKRRNVFRVGIAYVISTWVIAQVADLVLDSIEAPIWVMKTLLLGLALGFFVALIIAWAYELTPEGIKKEKDVVRDDSITNITAKKLDYITLAAAIIVLAFIGWQQMTGSEFVNGNQNKPLVSKSSSSETSGNIQVPPVETKPKIDNASIAVLPFADLSPEGDQEYFSDGISEEILNVLVRVKGLKVASRTSSFQFKKRHIGIPEIAQTLKVRHILEGSVRKAGDTLRITAQLIDTETDRHLWSETFDRPLTTENIFEIQDEISQAIVDALSKTITALAGTKVTVLAPTDNLTAYQLYLEALRLQRARIKLDVADHMLAQATEQDPTFAKAWELRSTVHALMADYAFTQDPIEEVLHRSAKFAKRALEIDPNSAGALTAIANIDVGRIQWLIDTDSNYFEIFDRFNRSVAIDPYNADTVHFASFAFMGVGYLEQSLEYMQKCVKLEPLYVPCSSNRVSMLTALNRDDEAIKLSDQLYSEEVMTPGDSNFGLFARSGQKLVFMINSADACYLQGWKRHGELYNAFRNLDADHSELIKDIKRYKPLENDFAGTLCISHILLALGDFSALPIVSEMWDPSLTVYRQSAQFKDFMRKTGAYDYWLKEGFPPQCRPISEKIGVENDFECD